MIHTHTVHQDGREYDVFKAVPTSSPAKGDTTFLRRRVSRTIFARERRQMFVRVREARVRGGGEGPPFSFLVFISAGRS